MTAAREHGRPRPAVRGRPRPRRPVPDDGAGRRGDRRADVIAYHSARHGRSIARSIAAEHLRPDHIEEALVYPVTTESTDHPGGYRGALDEFYESAAARLAAHLDAGRTVAVISEGDPLFYGSYSTCTSGWPTATRPR